MRDNPHTSPVNTAAHAHLWLVPPRLSIFTTAASSSTLATPQNTNRRGTAQF